MRAALQTQAPPVVIYGRFLNLILCPGIPDNEGVTAPGPIASALLIAVCLLTRFMHHRHPGDLVQL